MGSDNIYHKRKARQTADLKRRRQSRAPHEKVLVVCEGSKTEPEYFNDIKNYYRINSANIEISSDGGTSPLGIYQYAARRYTEEKNSGDPFDKVFCVFDKDTHPSYQDACRKIATAKPNNIFYAISSVPCFEYWLLLHFQYSTASCIGQSGNSAGDQMEAELRKYWPQYRKCMAGVFTQLIDQLDFAKKNAERSFRAVSQASTDNPSTKIHELVDYLQNIK